MRFFLDTEWADTLGSELVSIALVAENGIDYLYAEREVLPAHPTDFVRSVVYPLLDRGKAILPDQAMTTRIRDVLYSAKAPMICADYANDVQLLHYVLAGFELPDTEVSLCGPAPRVVDVQIIHDRSTAMLVEAYFEAHPAARARRHHALVDAEALRVAWHVSTGRMPCPSWGVDAMARVSAHPS
ncbi:3'-5' exoribonuclease [Xanthomonas sp. D-93]|nr:3'-5' exoribonuclease [Xanthomonas sp. D-93]